MNVLTVFSAIDKVTPTLDKVGKSASNLQSKLNNLSNKAAVAGGAIMTVAGGVLNKFIKLEDEFANLEKVYNASSPEKFREEFSKLTDQIMEFATTTRTTPEDLTKTAVELAKTGIEGAKLFDVLKRFDVINLALGDNFSGGAAAAAEAVTRITYLYKDIKDMEKGLAVTTVGNVLNELVQKMPVVKAEPVVEFMYRAGGMNDLVMPDTGTSAALGATLTGLGMNPEAAASGFQRAIRQMSLRADVYAKKMGISLDQLNTMLKEDSAGALIAYAQTLDGLSPSQFQQALKEVGLNLIYSEQALNKLSGASGLEFFNKSLKIATEATKDLSGVQEEANIVNTTSRAELQKLSNELANMAWHAGAALAPALKEVLEEMKPLLKNVVEMIKENPSLILSVVEWGAALMGLSIALKVVSMLLTVYRGLMIGINFVRGIYLAMTGQIITATVANAVVLKGMTFALKVATAAQWLLNAALTANPIGLIILAIVALIAIFYYWDDICKWFSLLWKGFTDWISERWEKVVNFFKEFDFKNFFKIIGNSIIEYLTLPLRGVLTILSKLPGKMGEIAKLGLDTLDDMKFTLNETETEKLPNASTKNTEQFMHMYGNLRPTSKDLIDININDKGGNVKGVKSDNIPVRLNSTKTT